MHGEAVGNVSEESKRVLRDIHSTYDMNDHFRDTSPQARVLTDDFIDSYAITGDPQRCLDQIAELLTLGIDRILVSTSARGSDRALTDDYRTVFAAEILPGLRDLRRP